MAPPAPRKLVPKDRLSILFAASKTQTYYDPSSRSPGSHASVSTFPSPFRSSSTFLSDSSPTMALKLTESFSIRTIAWNPTGHLIATGSQDRTLRIWNPDKPQVKNSTELRGHTGAIERVAWNPMKESELASVSADGTCRFWDVRSKGCIQTIQMGDPGWSISWAMDGSMVLLSRRVCITFHQTSSLQVNANPFLGRHDHSRVHSIIHKPHSNSAKRSDKSNRLRSQTS